VTLLLTARQLGPSLYGQYAGTLALASFSAILFNLGFDAWLLREGGLARDRLGVQVGNVLRIKLGLGSLWLVSWAILAAWIDSATFPASLMRLSALTIFLDGLLLTFLTAFRASLKNRITFLLEGASDAAWFLATLALIWREQDSPGAYFQIRILILAATVTIGAIAVHRLTGISPAKRRTIATLRTALPFATSDLLAWLYLRFDVIIIGFTLGEAAVGLYAPAVSLVNAFFLIPGAVYTTLVPVLSRLVADEPGRAWRTARQSLLFLAGLGALMTVGLFLGAEPLIGLLGDRFAGSVPVLKILAWLLWIHAIVFGLAAIIVVSNLQGRRTAIQGIAAIVNIGLNFWLVRYLGLIGVAWVYVLTDIVLLAGYAWIVFRHFPRHTVNPTNSDSPGLV